LSLPHVATIVSFPFDENTYVLSVDGSKECVVVDPGLEPAKILEHLSREGLVPMAILCTHGHSDHIAGNGDLKERWPECPLIIGKGDAPKLTDPELNLSAPFGFAITSPPADVLVSEGDSWVCAGMRFSVLDTPGHSAGHVVFVLDEVSPKLVLGGDVLFRQGVGRTDFPDGNPEALAKSIRQKLYALADDTIVYPGHGPETTIGFEKAHNPFVRA
jgi:hydroxyacylglutathione hydrolase